MFVYKNPPRPMGRLIADAWGLYRSTLLHIIWLSGVMALLTFFVELLQSFWLHRLSQSGQPHDMAIVFIVFAMIVMMFFTVFVSIVVLRYMDDLARGSGGSMKQVLGYACRWSRIFTLFRAMVLVLLMVAIGLALFVVPGIVLLVFAVLVMPLVVIQEDKAFAAVKHSFQYVWGNWWYSLGVMMAPIAAAIVLAFLCDRLVVDLLSRTILDVIISAVLTPWMYATQLVLLNELQWRHQQVYEG